MKRVSFIVLSILLLANTLAFAFNTQNVKASGTIYIRADGSIDPPTAPISSFDNITYTLTDNIVGEVPILSSAIVVERDSIVVDGASYTIQGTGAGYSKGICLSGRSNITIKNTQIKVFYYGIYVDSSSNNSISGNNITSNGHGIYFYSPSNYNTISGNNITNNNFGIQLSMSSNNVLRNNVMAANNYSFAVFGSTLLHFINDVDVSNTVNGKPVYYFINQKNLVIDPSTYPNIGYLALVNSTNITVEGLELKNNWQGILLAYSNDVLIRQNSITNNVRGIELWFSSYNTVSGNNIIENNDYGIYLQSSSNNGIAGNNITNNGIGICGYMSNYNTFSGNSIKANNWSGIEFDSSSNNTISENNITTTNRDGISLWMAPNNSIGGNNITNNGYGIYLDYSSNNVIYHNNFVDNAHQVYIERPGYTNFWDDGYPSGGNYWSDYAGVDLYSGSYQNETGSDGMGDNPYVIDLENQDNYPLMNPWPSGWKLDFAEPRNNPIVDFAAFNGSLYAAADNKLYVKNGSGWNAIEAPTYITSMEPANATNLERPLAEWNQTYGGAQADYARDLVQTDDDGYAIVGYTYSFGIGVDAWLVKTDGEGDMVWNQTYGGVGGDIANTLIQTSDGGYAIAGYTSSYSVGLGDCWLVKTNIDGSMQWNKTYGGKEEDEAYSVVETSDGGFAIAGWTGSQGYAAQFWLIKTDAAGNEVWNKTYGFNSTLPSFDFAWSMIQTEDGGYALAGTTMLTGGETHFWLVKTDAAGNMEWNQTYEGAWQEECRSVIQTSDGGYAMVGFTASGAAWDPWLVKVDALGNMQWNKTYGETGEDGTYSVIQTEDGGYALAGLGHTTGWNRDASVVKTDACGNVQWTAKYGGSQWEGAYSLVQTQDGGYAVAGITSSYGAGEGDFWLVKTSAVEPYLERLVLGGQGGLYCYDGASFSLIFSVPTYIKTLGVYNNTLHAGTMLDNPPKLYYCNGSAENPDDWHIDTGFSAILSFSGAFGSIDSFAVFNNVMYVGSGGKLYSFNGTDWSTVVSYDDVCAFLDLQAYDDKLYLATRDQGWRRPMYLGGSGFSGRVIEFDGENWTTVLDHDYWIYSLEEYDGKLYAGTANKILTYNGTSWETSFNATEGAYYAISMIMYDGKIYAGMGNGYVFADPASAKANPRP